MWSGRTPDPTGLARAIPGLALLVLVAAAAEAAPDPRVEVVERLAARDHAGALEIVERALVEDPANARRWGMDYLRGHLLLRTGRQQEALEAFAAALASAPGLSAYSRYRLAVEQEALGHPEVAAGLVATLLGSGPPKPLVKPAAALLERSIAAGGDCRLLARLDPTGWDRTSRRRLRLAEAECALRTGEAERAEARLFALLEERRSDEVARRAAERIVERRPGVERDARSHLLLGLTFHDHREFRTAIHHLARALVRLKGARDVGRREAFNGRYALARSHYWLGNYPSAAAAFDALARDTRDPEKRAQVLYQRARSFELAGLWTRAAATFREAYEGDPDGSWADAALISHLRLRWLLGDEDPAADVGRALVDRRAYDVAARALLFMASSDVVRGRSDRAGDWLATAARLGKVPRPELAYWSGRLEELRGNSLGATAHYARALADGSQHPLAVAARERLLSGTAGGEARALAQRLASSGEPHALYAAWRLVGDGDPVGRRARAELASRLAQDRVASRFLDLRPAPAASWPLWRASLRRPEEMLLALGIFGESAPVVLRHFPVAEPSLALTGGLLLAGAGETHEAMRVAEILAKRIPGRLPPELLPEDYRKLLFPLRYRSRIEREARRRGVDPFLLAAIIREESRFDPNAFSGASARGLTQFVFPTARRVAENYGLGEIEPPDLEKPSVAIALGAAYLGELSSEFGGAEHQMIAAYNAGEPQSDLWRRYCYSDEPEEYLTKVAFPETRRYLVKVLRSREHYRQLYGGT